MERRSQLGGARTRADGGRALARSRVLSGYGKVGVKEGLIHFVITTQSDRSVLDRWRVRISQTQRRDREGGRDRSVETAQNSKRLGPADLEDLSSAPISSSISNVRRVGFVHFVGGAQKGFPNPARD